MEFPLTVLSVAVAASLLGASDARKGLKLSGPMQPSYAGDVIELRIAPGGARVVYTGSGGAGGQLELYSVPKDRSVSPVQLSAPRVLGGALRGFLVSPDGQRVVYWADQATVGVLELYMVPIDGSLAPVRLHPAFAPLSGLGRPLVGVAVAISADSSRVVYLADTDSLGPEVFELFSVPIDASGPPVKLNAALVANGDVGEFVSSFTEQLDTRGFELSPTRAG
jgi:hypothetical protein